MCMCVCVSMCVCLSLSLSRCVCASHAHSHIAFENTRRNECAHIHVTRARSQSRAQTRARTSTPKPHAATLARNLSSKGDQPQDPGGERTRHNDQGDRHSQRAPILKRTSRRALLPRSELRAHRQEANRQQAQGGAAV
eukprot:Tamp_15704.p2 GENE.Tamp_15704~~Tamp_15704.p2  ORF type:complete len:138 (+),score=1.50 Tamp_15704:642-1055(+)